jgi:hypothetical protein
MNKFCKCCIPDSSKLVAHCVFSIAGLGLIRGSLEVVVPGMAGSDFWELEDSACADSLQVRLCEGGYWLGMHFD